MCARFPTMGWYWGSLISVPIAPAKELVAPEGEAAAPASEARAEDISVFVTPLLLFEAIYRTHRVKFGKHLKLNAQRLDRKEKGPVCKSIEPGLRGPGANHSQRESLH
jgi:hypothetical protein